MKIRERPRWICSSQEYFWLQGRQPFGEQRVPCQFTIGRCHSPCELKLVTITRSFMVSSRHSISTKIYGKRSSYSRKHSILKNCTGQNFTNPRISTSCLFTQENSSINTVLIYEQDFSEDLIRLQGTGQADFKVQSKVEDNGVFKAKGADKITETGEA